MEIESTTTRSMYMKLNLSLFVRSPAFYLIIASFFAFLIVGFAAGDHVIPAVGFLASSP